MRKQKVAFIWDVPPFLQKRFVSEVDDDLELLFSDMHESKDYENIVAHADVIVGWRATKSMLNIASKLKMFINPGAGIQHLINDDLKILQEKEVLVLNSHDNAYNTAQHAVAMLMALTNKLLPHHEWMKNGEWRKGDKDAKTLPIKYRKVGLMGFGHVNQFVHQFLKPYGCDFYVLRRKIDASITLNQFQFNQLKDFLSMIDTLIIAAPMTMETKNCIGEEELKSLGENGILVNVGRGPIIKEEALFRVLKNKNIAAAGIDVWYHYNPTEDKEGRKFPYYARFHELDNILLSPHRAGAPLDDYGRWSSVIENLNKFATGKKDFKNIVDLSLGY